MTVGVSVAVGVLVGEGVILGLGVAVGVGVGVAVGVDVGVGAGVSVRVGVTVKVAVAVEEGVGARAARTGRSKIRKPARLPPIRTSSRIKAALATGCRHQRRDIGGVPLGWTGGLRGDGELRRRRAQAL